MVTDYNELVERAQEIRDETRQEANSAARVGQFLVDTLGFLGNNGEGLHTNQVRGSLKIERDLTRRDALPVAVLSVGTPCLVLNAVTAEEDDNGKVVGPRSYTLVYAAPTEPESFQIPADASIDLSETYVKWVDAESKEAQQPGLKFFDPNKADGYAQGELAKYIFNGSTEFIQARKLLLKPANGTIPAPTTGGSDDENWEKVSADYVSALSGRITLEVARTFKPEETGTAAKVFFVRRTGKPEVRLEMDDDARFDLKRAKQFNAQTDEWELGTYNLDTDTFTVGSTGGSGLTPEERARLDALTSPLTKNGEVGYPTWEEALVNSTADDVLVGNRPYYQQHQDATVESALTLRAYALLDIDPGKKLYFNNQALVEGLRLQSGTVQLIEQARWYNGELLGSGTVVIPAGATLQADYFRFSEANTITLTGAGTLVLGAGTTISDPTIAAAQDNGVIIEDQRGGGAPIEVRDIYDVSAQDRSDAVNGTYSNGRFRLTADRPDLIGRIHFSDTYRYEYGPFATGADPSPLYWFRTPLI